MLKEPKACKRNQKYVRETKSM